MEKSIHDLEDLKATFDELMKQKAIFRGICSREQLLPKIIRDGDYSTKEKYILDLFEKYYGVYSETSNHWEFLALAQHYGLATRLIDFSYNPYVALFFALYDKEQSGKYEIFVIKKEDYHIIFDSLPVLLEKDENTGDFNLNIKALQEKGTFSKRIMDEFQTLHEKTGILAIRPNYKDLRMLMQQGLFVVPSILQAELINDTFIKNATIITIDPSLRNEALSFLDKLGFNELRLMPDLESLCREINHRVKEKII